MPEVANGGCKAKRERKKYEKKQKGSDAEKKPAKKPRMCSLERKRRRGRDNDLKKYVIESKDKIAVHMKEIAELEAAGDHEGAKRIKNIISAYESRIGKQLTAASFEQKVGVRDK